MYIYVIILGVISLAVSVSATMVGYSRLAKHRARREPLATNALISVSARTVPTVNLWTDHASALVDTMAQCETQSILSAMYSPNYTCTFCTAVINFVRTERMGSTAVGCVDVRIMAFALTWMDRALAWMGGMVPLVNWRVIAVSTVIAVGKNVCV